MDVEIKSDRKKRIAFFVLAAFLAVFLFSSLSFNPVHGLALINHTCQGAAKNAITESCALTVSAIGDLIVVVVTAWVNNNSCPAGVSSNSTGGSETYVRIGNTGCLSSSNGFGGIQIWMSDFVATSSSSHTVSVTLSSGVGTNGVFSVSGYDTSGSPTAIIGTATGNAAVASSGTFTTSTSVKFGSPAILIAGVVPSANQVSVPGAGTGFTTLTTHLGSGVDALNIYATDSGVTSPTNFPWTLSSVDSVPTAPFGEFAVAIGASPPGGGCSSASTCTSTQVLTQGNVEVVAIQWSTELTGVLTVTDTLGNVYKPVIPAVELTSCDSSGCINGHTVSSSIFDSQITVGGTATITVTMSGSTTNIGINFYSLSGFNPTPICVAGWSTATGVTSTVIATSTPCTSSATDEDIASIGGFGSFALTAGASFTLTNSLSTNFGAQIAQIQGSTSFPASIASATIVSEVAMVLAPTSQLGNVVLGSCPTKNTATNALTNSTVYFWTGTVLQGEQVNTLQTEVTSVNSGHVASETLALAVYATPGTGSVSVNNPLTLVGNSFKFFTLTPTSSPQSLLWSANVNLGTNGIPPGATVAIAIQGNSKILINSSSLAGMQTAAGTIGAGNQFTALSATSTQLFFCGSLSYQVIVTTTTTFSTTTSIISTVTTTINQAGVVTNTNAYLALAIIVTLFLIMAKIGGLPGAMLGAILGVIVVVMAGFLTGAPAYVTIVLIGLGSLAVIVSRISNPGSSGGGM